MPQGTSYRGACPAWGVKQRVTEMTEFQTEQIGDVKEYHEQLVRRLVKKVTVYDEKFVVEFRSKGSMDVE